MAKSPRTVFRSEVIDALRDGGVAAQVYDRHPAVLTLPAVAVVGVSQERERISASNYQIDLRATVEITADPHAESGGGADDVTDDVVQAFLDATLDLSDASVDVMTGFQYDEEGEFATIIGDAGEELHLNTVVLYARTATS